MMPTYTPATGLLHSWFADVERMKPPDRYTLPGPFASLDIRPGRLVMFGGAPGCGKTAAILQVCIDMLRTNEAARILISNVEMAETVLVDRIVSRLSGVPATAIMDRTLTSGQLDRVRVGVDTLATVAGRLAFLGPPYSLSHVAQVADEFKANVLVLDYLQRFKTGDERSDGKEKREQLENAAEGLRRFCDAARPCSARPQWLGRKTETARPIAH